MWKFQHRTPIISYNEGFKKFDPYSLRLALSQLGLHPDKGPHWSCCFAMFRSFYVPQRIIYHHFPLGVVSSPGRGPGSLVSAGKVVSSFK